MTGWLYDLGSKIKGVAPYQLPRDKNTVLVKDSDVIAVGANPSTLSATEKRQSILEIVKRKIRKIIQTALHSILKRIVIWGLDHRVGRSYVSASMVQLRLWV